MNVAGSNEEKYEPQNSILDLWHQEYKIISESADSYLDDAITNFETICNNSTGDVFESLKEINNILNGLKDSFNNIKGEIEDIFIDSSDTIDEYGKLGFKLVFSVLGLMNIALAVFVLFICLFSGKKCTKCCCCRCLFKFLTHLLWNILYLLMFITFILGFLFAFIGTIGNDAMSVISFIISKDNLGQGKDNIIVDQLGDAKVYLDICINGNGSIIDLLNIDTSQLNSFNNMTNIEKQINHTKKEFQDKKSFVTYYLYVDQLKARLNLSEMPILIKDDYNIHLPIEGSQISETQADKFLKFDIELRLMNDAISVYGETANNHNNEKWVINSNSPNECSLTDSADNSFSLPDINPLKCSPYDRFWIRQPTTNDKITNEAKIISDTLIFLNNAIKKTDPQNYDSESFMFIIDALKEKYNEFLNQYIRALEECENILNNITREIKKYIGDGDPIFSFMNGKFIGLNLKVILKYLKTALGKDVKTIGICLIVVGCSLALSISSTILLIIIINIAIDENKAKIKKEVEEKIKMPEFTQDSKRRIITTNN